MPRNYENENKWQSMKYKQILFKVSAELAEEFREHLAKHDMKPVEWFRYAVQLGLVPPEYTSQGKIEEGAMQDTDISMHQHSVKCARCGTLSSGYVDGYYKCAECEFGNYEETRAHDVVEQHTVAHDEIDDEDDTDISIESTQEETATMVEVSEKITVEEPPRKKRRTISPTNEMVEAWIEMHGGGMSYVAIAKTTESYDSTTIRKRVAKELEKMPVPDSDIVKYWCALRNSGHSYIEIAEKSYLWLHNGGLSHAEIAAKSNVYYAAFIRRYVDKELTKDGTGSSAI